MSNAIVGINDYLITYLTEAIAKAESIKFNVAFLMESGAKLIAPPLKTAAARGTKIKILTGRYMNVTEPSAIYYLFDQLENKVDLRFYSDRVRSFHPKAYIFEYPHEAEVFVGSSNLSLSALTFGLEWNYRLLKSENPSDYAKFSSAFDDLFANCSEIVDDQVLRHYALGWKKPISSRIEQNIEQDLIGPSTTISPRGAQIEALYELKKAREEGIGKGLVVAATGTGKTYLAAFDSLEYKHILFIAHREEILTQAFDSFNKVRPGVAAGFYTGAVKDAEKDIYFATVQTLAREQNLTAFPSDYFDYIIIDEFHHAAANSYRAILTYFKPRFLLGLTATPYRTDNRDIFVLCDDNVIYEIYLRDAINRDLLVPFKYYGIYDETDYSQVEYKNGKYVTSALERELSRTGRAELILEKYNLLAGSRTLAFCTSINHANYMAEYFNERKIPSAAVHSGSENGSQGFDRIEAVKSLAEGQLKVIFAVDIFNEGVDIPSVDTVMFLRPTESFVVFLQQLGRGLRKDDNKNFLTVLDFIGNYKRAHYIPALLAGENPLHPINAVVRNMAGYDYPDDCQVQFDFKVLDLFATLSKNDPLKKRMINDFYRLMDNLGRRPTRLDVYTGSDIPMREFLKDGWLRFLESIDELNPLEYSWLNTPAELFLKDLEKTSMSKAYKIPTIGALLSEGTILKKVSLAHIGENFMSFYKDQPLHWKDLQDKSNRNWRNWTLDDFTRLARKNPVHFLSNGRFFNYDEVNKQFYLADEIDPYLGRELAEHVHDILEYKELDYFRKRFKEDD